MHQDPQQAGSFNPYAAPSASLRDTDAMPPGEPAFFSVGVVKLCVMSVLTCGAYGFYWHYRNWRAVQRHHQVRMWAPLRALLFPLTAYFLFLRIVAESRRLGIETSLQVGALAVGVFVICTLARLPEPWWLLSLLSFLPLIPMQSAVNEINERVAPGADTNMHFSAENYIATIAGSGVMLWIVVGMFLD